MNISASTRKHISRALIWWALANNAAVVALEVAYGMYRAAALQSLVVAAAGVFLYLLARFDEWIDAKVARAVYEREIAEQVLRDFQRMKRAGYDVRLDGSIGVAPGKVN